MSAPRLEGQTPSSESNGSPDAVPPIIQIARTVVANFPELWPAVEAGLSTCATLLLSENTNPAALIYVGGPSTGKTTVASMFEGARIIEEGESRPLCYRSDKFTPAAFVSQAANRTSKDLSKVDLLPRIKNRVLLTPELAPIFRGKDDDLTNTFSTITRVLDGQGLQTDSGTHGQRGYSGPHLFAWIGCTTPFDARVWKVMSQLGSRLFFLIVQAGKKVTIDDLLAMGAGPSYQARLDACRAAVHGFLQDLFGSCGGVRSVTWRPEEDDAEARLWLARCAVLLAAMRSVPVEEREPSSNRILYRAGCAEGPERAQAVLTNVARGRALVHGRQRLTMQDVPLIVSMTVSSMPGDGSVIFRRLVENDGDLSVEKVRTLLGAEHPETARNRMRYLGASGVLEFDNPGQGMAGVLRFRPEWEWCASPEFRQLLLGLSTELVRPEVVCSKPSASNLVEHQEEGERSEGLNEGEAHTGPAR